MADLDAKYIEWFWKGVATCLQEVFGWKPSNASSAVSKLRTKTGKLSDEAALLTYHDSPLRIAADIAGAENRPLTREEVLAFDKLINSQRPDRPTFDEIVHGFPAG